MIGPRMRKLRLARGLTQRELAEPGYTHAYVSTIEAGRRTPSRDALEYFASKLGVDIAQLTQGRPADLEARLALELQEARIAVSEGRFDEADAIFGSIEKDAKRYALTRTRAKVEEIRGLSLEERGRREEALEHYQRAEELLSDDPPTARVDAVAGKARCFTAIGDVRYAIFLLESLRDAIERERLSDPDALARIHAGLVFSYLDAGLYRKAAESAAELEALAPRLADPLRVAQMHMNVARLHLTEGRIDDAERSLAKAEETYRVLGLKGEIGGAHLARGYVLSRDGRLSEAREHLELAVGILEETGNVRDLTRALNELARVERLEGQSRSARELLERSIALLGDGDTPISAWAHRELGLTIAESEPDTAEKELRTAIELYERSEQVVDLAVTYRSLGDHLASRGQGEASCDAYRTGIMALEPGL